MTFSRSARPITAILVACAWHLSFWQLATVTNSFPSKFVTRHARASCTEQPNEPLGPHTAPVEDGSIAVNLILSGAESHHFCPGERYLVKVSFPDKRLGMLTINHGTSNSSTCTSDISSRECCSDSTGTRWLLATRYDDKQERFDVDLKLPCGIKDELVVKVTSATSSSSHFLQTTKRFQIGSDCGACVPDTRPPPAAPFFSTPPRPVQKPRAGAVTNTIKAAVSPPAVTNLTAMNVTKCEISSPNATALGYSHAANLGDVTMHWSYGDCAPRNPCTEGAWSSDIFKNLPAGTMLLHLAAEAPTAGYVALGFGKEPTKMDGTDAVLGYLTAPIGAGVVKAFRLGADTLGEEYPEGSPLMLYSGVLQMRGASGEPHTIVCFARALDVSEVKGAAKLSLQERVAVNWAVSDKDQLQMHSSSGGAWVLLDAPQNSSQYATVQVVKSSKLAMKRAHGVMMVLVWFGLTPLAVLSARHRSLFGEMTVLGKPCWLVVHQVLQCLAVGIQLGSAIMAWLKFNAGSGLGTAHLGMGSAAVALSLLQFAAACARPKVQHAYHATWSAAHRIAGVTLVLLGGSTCIVGAILIHCRNGDPLWPWVGPCVAAAITFALMDGSLTLWQHLQSRKRNSQAITVMNQLWEQNPAAREGNDIAASHQAVHSGGYVRSGTSQLRGVALGSIAGATMLSVIPEKVKDVEEGQSSGQDGSVGESDSWC